MTKPMSIQARKEMLASIRTKYQVSDWKMKNKLLDGLIAATGYERKYGIKLLNGNASKTQQTKKSGRPVRYDQPIVALLNK
jgi:hypothetical protein